MTVPTCLRHPSIKGWVDGEYFCSACKARYVAGVRPVDDPRPPAPAATEPASKARPRRRMKSTTIYIRVDQEAGLKAMSAHTGVPFARYIREGIDIALAKYRGRS